MEPSNLLLKLTKLALDAIIKFSKADIRVHDAERIPEQPCIFVINHFTRLETFVMPYMLHKLTGKNTLSMAHHSFFSGAFGTYMTKLGAISTKDPERDRKIIGALLRGDYSVMVFPEGQMVKDKKLVEKGKYMIYNTGIRRPPHTGSGILALRAEFYRAKMAHLLKNGNQRELQEYIGHFELGSAGEVERITGLETCIVPVNITYFPIRARNNAINRLANYFVHTLPERIEEELEVEGTMITEGVDIDINFGAPIYMKEYLSSGATRRAIGNEKLYLSAIEIKGDLHFSREALDLMYRYMYAIYGMTTVNHDHIFAYILERYRRRKIRVDDFKNRAYLAIDRIQSVTMQSHHTTLKMRQNYLLTDDLHARFVSFMDAAKSDGLISEEQGFIYKNRDRFSKLYEFHDIRKDNIVEVLRNEIEPLDQVVRNLNAVMRAPACILRRRIRKMYRALDLEYFEQDYQKYFIEGESKPRNIGRPFFLKRFFSSKGVLLVHGYMAAPEEMRALGEFLYRRGFTVYGVRMRGHGTAPEDLQERTWEEWYESVNRGYVVLKNTVKRMAVVGFSTGAGLALLQAVNKSDRFAGMVSINAPLRINNIGSRMASTIVHWNNFMDRLSVKKGKLEFVANTPENQHINYFRNPVRGVAQLEKFMRVVDQNLPELCVPALIIQGSNDPVVNPVSGPEIFDRIGCRNKELCRLFADRHGIVNGEGSHRVFMRVLRFLDDVM
ncbi:MAG: alpha/beta fold hydrolase [Spirochaetes bacterium]|nr:MAG: alpha/beta fold hydrolase [Spirochaetota bacterium]